MGFCGELLANALGGSLSSLLGPSVGAERTLGRVFGDRAGGGRGRWHSAAARAAELPEPEPLARGGICLWRSGGLAPRLVGAPRLAARWRRRIGGGVGAQMGLSSAPSLAAALAAAALLGLAELGLGAGLR